MRDVEIVELLPAEGPAAFREICVSPDANWGFGFREFGTVKGDLNRSVWVFVGNDDFRTNSGGEPLFARNNESRPESGTAAGFEGESSIIINLKPSPRVPTSKT